jgi:hypothetical protein
MARGELVAPQVQAAQVVRVTELAERLEQVVLEARMAEPVARPERAVLVELAAGQVEQAALLAPEARAAPVVELAVLAGPEELEEQAAHPSRRWSPAPWFPTWAKPSVAWAMVSAASAILYRQCLS